MDSFSERHGFEPKKPIQIDSMNDELKTDLWNALDSFFWAKRRLDRYTCSMGLGDHFSEQPLKGVVKALWRLQLNLPMDQMPSDWRRVIEVIRTDYSKMPWNKVYDFIEFMAAFADDVERGSSKDFRAFCNGSLERENAGYRFVGDKIAPITNSAEIAEIENALVSPMEPVRTQIESALKKLSDKKDPDYRNCIKDSIGAVESAARIIVNDPKAALTSALGDIGKKLRIHPEIIEAWKRHYKYASTEVRHGPAREPILNAALARYFLISCSAFINYLTVLEDELGLMGRDSV